MVRSRPNATTGEEEEREKEHSRRHVALDPAKEGVTTKPKKEQLISSTIPDLGPSLTYAQMKKYAENIHRVTEKLLEENDDSEIILRKRMMAAHQIVKSLTEETIANTMFPSKVFQMNKGLIHILEIINNSPSGTISTRDLLRTVNSYNMHKLIERGQRLGLIKRETTKMPKGKKGGRMVVNSLTYDGKLLLDIAERKENK